MIFSRKILLLKYRFKLLKHKVGKGVRQDLNRERTESDLIPVQTAKSCRQTVFRKMMKKLTFDLI